MVNQRIIYFACLTVLSSCVDLRQNSKPTLRQTATSSVALNLNAPYFFYTGSSSFGTPAQTTSGTIFDSTQSIVQAS